MQLALNHHLHSKGNSFRSSFTWSMISFWLKSTAVTPWANFYFFNSVSINKWKIELKKLTQITLVLALYLTVMQISKVHCTLHSKTKQQCSCWCFYSFETYQYQFLWWSLFWSFASSFRSSSWQNYFYK